MKPAAVLAQPEPVQCQSCGEFVARLIKCFDEDGDAQEWCQSCADQAHDIEIQRAQERADTREAEKAERRRTLPKKRRTR